MIPLAVNEIFGPTFQGEGASLGKQAIFLRLTGCNLACTWCDTPFTWKWTEWNKQEQTHLMMPNEIAESLYKLDGLNDSEEKILVVSGGEPLLQQKGIVQLLDIWEGPIEIETNGTVVPCEALDIRRITFNVSPKLSHSGNEPRPYKMLEPALRPIWSKTNYKFVCNDVTDLDEVASLIETFQLHPERIWIMPEGIDAETLRVNSRHLADEVLRRGWKMTMRLHVLLWGNERGR